MVFLSPLSTTEAPSTLTSTTTSAESVPSTNLSTAELINQIQKGQWYSTDTGSPGAKSIPGVTPNIASHAPRIIGGGFNSSKHHTHNHNHPALSSSPNPNNPKPWLSGLGRPASNP